MAPIHIRSVTPPSVTKPNTVLHKARLNEERTKAPLQDETDAKRTQTLLQEERGAQCTKPGILTRSITSPQVGDTSSSDPGGLSALNTGQLINQLAAPATYYRERFLPFTDYYFAPLIKHHVISMQNIVDWVERDDILLILRKWNEELDALYSQHNVSVENRERRNIRAKCIAVIVMGEETDRETLTENQAVRIHNVLWSGPIREIVAAKAVPGVRKYDSGSIASIRHQYELATWLLFTALDDMEYYATGYFHRKLGGFHASRLTPKAFPSKKTIPSPPWQPSPKRFRPINEQRHGPFIEYDEVTDYEDEEITTTPSTTLPESASGTIGIIMSGQQYSEFVDGVHYTGPPAKAVKKSRSGTEITNRATGTGLQQSKSNGGDEQTAPTAAKSKRSHRVKRSVNQKRRTMKNVVNSR